MIVSWVSKRWTTIRWVEPMAWQVFWVPSMSVWLGGRIRERGCLEAVSMILAMKRWLSIMRGKMRRDRRMRSMRLLMGGRSGGRRGERNWRMSGWMPSQSIFRGWRLLMRWRRRSRKMSGGGNPKIQQVWNSYRRWMKKTKYTI